MVILCITENKDVLVDMSEWASTVNEKQNL